MDFTTEANGNVERVGVGGGSCGEIIHVAFTTRLARAATGEVWMVQVHLSPLRCYALPRPFPSNSAYICYRRGWSKITTQYGHRVVIGLR